MPAGSVFPGWQEAGGLHPHLPHQEEQQLPAAQRQRLHPHPAEGSSARSQRGHRGRLA